MNWFDWLSPWRRAVSLPWNVACTGTVVDTEGHPLYYVLASFDGLNVRTDANGVYSLNLEPGKEYTVLFSDGNYYPASITVSTVNRAAGDRITVPPVALQRLPTAPPPEQTAEPQRGEPVTTITVTEPAERSGIQPIPVPTSAPGAQTFSYPPAQPQPAPDLRPALAVGAAVAAAFALLYFARE